MSREVLINDLRSKGELRIESLWREARAEAERWRSEAAARVAAERLRCEQAGREGGQAVQRRRTMAARRQAGMIISKVEQELSGRLYGLALGLLVSACSGDRAALQAGLAAELPGGDWGKVRCHPEDVAVTGALFPAAAIDADPRVLGGLEVTSRDGGMIIDNTLTTRLERIWPRLLPELLREAREDGASG